MDLEWRDQLLFFKGKIWVPEGGSLYTQILQYFHDSLIGGHSGIYCTWARVTTTFYWPGVKSDVKKYVSQCEIFQRVKNDSRRPSALLQPLPIPERIWEDITMDFIEGLPRSNGYNGILEVVD